VEASARSSAAQSVVATTVEPMQIGIQETSAQKAERKQRELYQTRNAPGTKGRAEVDLRELVRRVRVNRRAVLLRLLWLRVVRR
jgi:hypothetical protein